jgi:uncharacterized protein (DUF58 family)
MPKKIIILLLVALGLLLIALTIRNGEIAWMIVPILVYIGVGIWHSPTSERIHIHANRTVEVHWSDDVATIGVEVTIRNAGAALPCLFVSDILPTGVRLPKGKNELPLTLGEGASESLKYSFRTGRGSFSWDAIRVVVSDPFQLVETNLQLPTEASTRILPALKKFRPFTFRTQNTIRSAGSIPARVGGSGTNFWGVREYHPGDSLRRLDWRLTARHPHQFFTKEFEQEEIADIGIILDARQKTDVRLAEDSLFEHATRAAASLAEMFLRQGNRVSLHLYGEPVVNLYPGYGKVQLHRILQTLAQTTRQPDVSLSSLQFLSMRLFSNQSLMIIISPLAANDWLLFPRLRAYGCQVLLISPDPFDYIKHALPADAETQMSGRISRLERQMEISRITKLWIPVIDWQVSQPLSPLVNATLHHAHVQRAR